MWQQVDRALADVPAMGAVIARLTAELGMRMERANLLAAMRAALAAHAEGEPDPLWYIRDAVDDAGGAAWRVTPYRRMRRMRRRMRRHGNPTAW